MVYNRLVVLEKLAEQFPSSPASSSSPSSSTVRDQDYISDLFGPSYSKENPLFSSSSSPSFTGKDERESIYKDQLNGQGTRLKVMKDLIQLLSKTLTQVGK
ncbi:unnamed protein product [Trichobilharzia regenti]|nr:unnamed protein product [Trichobilharzia regenti]